MLWCTFAALVAKCHFFHQVVSFEAIGILVWVPRRGKWSWRSAAAKGFALVLRYDVEEGGLLENPMQQEGFE